MGPNGRRRLKRFAIAAPLAVGATALAGLLWGPLVEAATAAIGFLAVAIAADDKVGTCFPLAVLFVIIVVLLMMALFAAVMVNLR